MTNELQCSDKTCKHHERFSGVFGLPKDCNGCMACHAEKLASDLTVYEPQEKDGPTEYAVRIAVAMMFVFQPNKRSEYLARDAVNEAMLYMQSQGIKGVNPVATLNQVVDFFNIES